MIFAIIFLIVAGIAEAVMDTLAHHFETSMFKKLDPQFWNPVISGGNKWKDGDKVNGERFLGSSTLFVSFTEAWHVFKFIRTSSIFIGIAFLVGGWKSLFLLFVFKEMFTIFYKLFQTK